MTAWCLDRDNLGFGDRVGNHGRQRIFSTFAQGSIPGDQVTTDPLRQLSQNFCHDFGQVSNLAHWPHIGGCYETSRLARAMSISAHPPNLPRGPLPTGGRSIGDASSAKFRPALAFHCGPRNGRNGAVCCLAAVERERRDSGRTRRGRRAPFADIARRSAAVRTWAESRPFAAVTRSRKNSPFASATPQVAPKLTSDAISSRISLCDHGTPFRPPPSLLLWCGKRPASRSRPYYQAPACHLVPLRDAPLARTIR